jgi:hypothetical protein
VSIQPVLCTREQVFVVCSHYIQCKMHEEKCVYSQYYRHKSTGLYTRVQGVYIISNIGTKTWVHLSGDKGMKNGASVASKVSCPATRHGGVWGGGGKAPTHS